MKNKSDLGANPAETVLNRRRLLQFLAASPVIAGKAKDLMAAEGEMVPAVGARAEDPYIWKPYDPNYLLEKAEDALDVFDFEATAHKNMIASFSQTHWGFMSTGADSEDTYRANRHDIAKFAMRSRRLREVEKVDTTRELIGTKWSQPFFICPTGRNGAYHAEGEVGVGKAAGKHNIMQGLATNATFGFTDVNKARGNGTSVVFQLYQQANFEHSKALIQRAEREGCKAIMLTVDGVSSRKDMQFARQARDDKKLCLTCHTIRPGGNPRAVQLSSKIDGNFSQFTEDMWNQKFDKRDSMTWDWPKRVRDITKMDIFIKGITDVEDALQCVKLGYGIHVSNHGGRNEDTGRSTIHSLSLIAPAVKGRAPILVDSGFRRGMDIVKALSMGATMVGFGRPYIWGLGAFGSVGVDKVISILSAEVEAAMRQVGVASVKELTPDLVIKAL